MFAAPDPLTVFGFPRVLPVLSDHFGSQVRVTRGPDRCISPAPLEFAKCKALKPEEQWEQWPPNELQKVWEEVRIDPQTWNGLLSDVNKAMGTMVSGG